MQHLPPFACLSVTGAGTGTGSAFVVAYSANTQRFTILDNGNVGIATTSPSRALSVEGYELILALQPPQRFTYILPAPSAAGASNLQAQATRASARTQRPPDR